MFTKKTAPPHDPGLQQIASWHSWFVSGHTARLAETDLTPDVRAHELTAIVAQAAAIRERLESDYRSNQSRRQP